MSAVWSFRINSGILVRLHALYIALNYACVCVLLSHPTCTSLVGHTLGNTRQIRYAAQSVRRFRDRRWQICITANLISVSLLIDSGRVEQGWFRIVNDGPVLGFIAAYVKTSRFVLLARKTRVVARCDLGGVACSRDRAVLREKSASIRCFSA